MTAEPMYPQIAEDLRGKIKSGETERGSRLPTEIELMEEYNAFYPMSLVERKATRLIQAQQIPEGTVHYLADACGIRQAGYRERISARTLDETETAFFRLPADGRVSVVEIFRVVFAENGGSFRLMVTVYPADRNQFLINVGEIPASHPAPWRVRTMQTFVAVSRAAAQAGTTCRAASWGPNENKVNADIQPPDSRVSAEVDHG